MLAAAAFSGDEMHAACSRIGLSVPDDIAVIGVGNDQPVCELSMPALSSVDVNAQAAGYEAAAWLDRRVVFWRER